MPQLRHVGIVAILHSVRRTDNMQNYSHIKPTKEQFLDYIDIQKSGITNMYAADVVCAFSEVGLTIENCLYIYDHYDELMEEYNVKR